MGNKKIICKHNVEQSVCPFGCESSKIRADVDTREVKIATSLSVPQQEPPEATPVVENATKKQLGGVTGKGFMPGKSGNPKGRRKGELSYKTVFFQCLKQLKDTKGRKITEHDLIKAGIMPLLAGMAKGDTRFHTQYKDVLDRIYGKPTEHLDHTTGGDKIKAPVTIIGMKFINQNKEN